MGSILLVLIHGGFLCFGGMGDQALQFPIFSWCQFAVFADRQIAQFDIHDPNADQFGHLIAEIFAHSSDLSIQALRQDNAESGFAQLLDHTFFSHRSEDGDTIAHPGNKVRSNGLVYRDDVFLVMLIASPEDLVDDVAIVCEEDESLRGFVQSADREEALLVPDIGDDVFGFFGIGGTNDPYRLIERDVQGLWFGLERFSIDTDNVSRKYPIARPGGFTIQGYSAAIDQPVSFPARADTGLADVLVEADRIVVGCFQLDIVGEQYRGTKNRASRAD